MNQPNPTPPKHSCTYSRAMNQPYPRLCIVCKKPEPFIDYSNAPKPAPPTPPKSAEEVLSETLPLHATEWLKIMPSAPLYSCIIQAMQYYASQFARYVTDEEIDERWPDEWESEQCAAAKEMRDMIFGHRSA